MLTLVVLVVLALAAWHVQSTSSRPAFFAVLTAAFVCWLSSLASLAVTDRVRGTANSTVGLLLAILIRTGVPLAAAFVLPQVSPVLAEGGVFGWLVCFYLPTLLAEAVLSIGLISATGAKSGVS